MYSGLLDSELTLIDSMTTISIVLIGLIGLIELVDLIDFYLIACVDYNTLQPYQVEVIIELTAYVRTIGSV